VLSLDSKEEPNELGPEPRVRSARGVLRRRDASSGSLAVLLEGLCGSLSVSFPFIFRSGLLYPSSSLIFPFPVLISPSCARSRSSYFRNFVTIRSSLAKRNPNLLPRCSLVYLLRSSAST